MIYDYTSHYVPITGTGCVILYLNLRVTVILLCGPYSNIYTSIVHYRNYRLTLIILLNYRDCR